MADRYVREGLQGETRHQETGPVGIILTLWGQIHNDLKPFPQFPPLKRSYLFSTVAHGWVENKTFQYEFLGDSFHLDPNHSFMFVEKPVVRYFQDKGMESRGCNYIQKSSYEVLSPLFLHSAVHWNGSSSKLKIKTTKDTSNEGKLNLLHLRNEKTLTELCVWMDDRSWTPKGFKPVCQGRN